MRQNGIARKTNAKLLKQWLAEQGSKGMAALLESGLSVHTITRLLQGTYPNTPRAMTRKALCVATGFSEAELFPLESSEATKVS